MNLTLTLRVLGGLAVFEGLVLLIPLVVSLALGDGAGLGFFVGAVTCILVGITLYRYFATREEMTHREAFAVVTFGWLLFAVLGAVPYLAAQIPVGTGTNGQPVAIGPIEAFFEAMPVSRPPARPLSPSWTRCRQVPCCGVR